MALETQAGFKFIGHQLEVGRLLEWDELLDEGDRLRRPVGPMVAAGEPGGEMGAFAKEASAEPVKMGATDLELEGRVSDVDQTLIELLKDLLEKQVGDTFGELPF